VSDTELLHKAKPEPVRRLEVFTGAGRRRSWTAEQKAQILAESYESGEKVSAVARRHGLTPQQLFGWRRDAERAVARRGVIERASSPVFTPVIVDAAAPSTQVPVAAAQLSGSLAIEIVIGSASIRIAPGADAGTLAMVLRAVKAAT
jgi:transposase